MRGIGLWRDKYPSGRGRADRRQRKSLRHFSIVLQ